LAACELPEVRQRSLGDRAGGVLGIAGRWRGRVIGPLQFIRLYDLKVLLAGGWGHRRTGPRMTRRVVPDRDRGSSGPV